MVEEANSFKPYGTEVGIAKLLLMVPINAGKSSYISSLSSIDKDRVAMPALAGASQISYTTRMQQWFPKHKLGGFHYCIIDTMGVEEVEQHGIHANDIIMLMEGHVKPTYKFKHGIPIDPDNDPEYIKDPTLKDKPQCSAILIDSNMIETGSLSAEMQYQLSVLQKHIKEKEVPVVIILTKIDKICIKEGIGIEQVFTSRKIKEYVDYLSTTFGVPEMHIFPVQNYCKETGLDCNMDILLLLALQKMLHIANDRLEYIDDQSK